MTEPLFIFTTAPTGLGHIRVMNALKEALPVGADSEIIGLQQYGANRQHVLSSRNPLLLKIMEFVQTHSWAERIASTVIVWYVKKHAAGALLSLDLVAKKHPEKKHWVIIATHYALAFWIAAHRSEIMEKFGVKITLCVTVTDDSPQRPWLVKDADLVFVPSRYTANTMIGFGMSAEKIRVVAYPISPLLTQKLSASELQLVTDQLDPTKQTPLQIVIPISGAAVQLNYLEHLIRTLSYGNFFFTVVGQESSYTQQFFEDLTHLSHVQTSIGASNLQTVEFYDSIFDQTSRPAVEITKPSEQSFKALLEPNERGGVILLFTRPVGRQENDNIAFMRRHGIMPSEEQEQNLEEVLLSSENPDQKILTSVLSDAKQWRCLSLPTDAAKTVIFIQKLKQLGILNSMSQYTEVDNPELRSDGVATIWKEVGKLSSAE